MSNKVLPLRRLPKRLKALINTYYAFQARTQCYAANGTLDRMPHHKDWKNTCLRAIDNACIRYDIALCAAGGTFFLVKGRRKAEISQPFPPDEV